MGTGTKLQVQHKPVQGYHRKVDREIGEFASGELVTK